LLTASPTIEIVSYCSEPSPLARLFVRPDLGYMCLLASPQEVEVHYRVVSYVRVGDIGRSPTLPPSQSCFLQATRRDLPALTLAEDTLLSFGGQAFARIIGLRTPWWRTSIRLENTATVGALPDARSCLLTYLQLETVDPTTVTPDMREQALHLAPSPVYF
jgi:hypothetical protein